MSDHCTGIGKWIGILTVLIFLKVGIRPLSAKPDMKKMAQRVIVQFQHRDWFREDISAYVWKDRIYVPMIFLFDRLSLKISFNKSSAELKGFFMAPDRRYVVNLNSGLARHDTTTIDFKATAFIMDGNEVYMDTELLNRLFQLGLHYESRDMKIHMRNQFEFPYMRRAKRQAYSRSRLKGRQGDNPVHHYVSARSSLTSKFTPGLTGWAIYNGRSAQSSYHAFVLQQAGYFFGGDYKFRSKWAHYDQSNFDLEGRWRKIWFRNSVVKQISAGTAVNVSHHPLRNRRYLGFKITNRSPFQNELFTRYDISIPVGENRDIALYHNQRLVDYRMTDQKQNLEFEIPIKYGSHALDLEINGPYGEFRKINRYIRIPRNMIPAGKWKYSLAAGRFSNHGYGDNRQNPLGGEVTGGYGITDEISVRGGLNIQNIDPVWDGFVHAIWNFNKRHTFTGFVTGFKESGISWNYYQPGKWRLHGFYERSRAGIARNRIKKVSFQDSWKVGANINWNYREISGFSYLTNRMDGRSGMKNGTLRLGTLLRWNRLHWRIEPGWKYRLSQSRIQTIYTGTKSSLGYRVFRDLRCNLTSRLNLHLRRVEEVGMQFNKRFNRQWDVSVGGSWQNHRNRWRVSLAFRLELSVLKSQTRSRFSGVQWSMDNRMSGNMWYDNEQGRLRFGKRDWSGRGRAHFKPFLDKDGNGHKGDKEKWLNEGIYNNSAAGKFAINDLSETARLYPAYTNQIAKFESLVLPQLRIRKEFEKLSFNVYPGIVNLIPVPLDISGNIAGKVRSSEKRLNNRFDNRGEWHLILEDQKSAGVDTLRTLPSGRFYRNSLSEGSYKIRVSEDQLKDRRMKSVPEEYVFTIGNEMNRRSVNDLTFFLQSL